MDGVLILAPVGAVAGAWIAIKYMLDMDAEDRQMWK